MMEFKKGMSLKVTTWKSKQYKDVEDTVEIVQVKKVTKRNGITRLHVWSDLGHGYVILFEKFQGHYGVVENV